MFHRGNGQGLTPAEKRANTREGVASAGVVKVSSKKRRFKDFPAEEFDFGVSAAQGPRETMEDEAVVFETGKCGYMYASKSYRFESFSHPNFSIVVPIHISLDLPTGIFCCCYTMPNSGHTVHPALNSAGNSCRVGHGSSNFIFELA